MDLLDNYMALDFNPLNVMSNLTSYSFNAKHVLNPQDLHDFIAPVSWKQQSPMPAPHDHSVLGSINHYPDNIIVGHDAGNIPNIVIDSHALASHHHHHHHHHHNHHHHGVMLSSPHGMHYNSNGTMHSPSPATDYDLSITNANNANNVVDDDDDDGRADILNFGMANTGNFREILLDHGMTTTPIEPHDNANHDNVGLPRQHYDPQIQLYLDGHHHQPKCNNDANNASSNVIIINGDMDMGSLMTTQSNAGHGHDHLIHSNNNNNNNNDMNEDDHGSNIEDILMLVSRGISIDPIDHMMGNDTNIVNHDPTSLSLGNYPNGMSRNGISANYQPLIDAGPAPMRLGDHVGYNNSIVGTNRKASVNNNESRISAHDGGDQAGERSMGFSGARSSTICFGQPPPPPPCIYDMMGGNENTGGHHHAPNVVVPTTTSSARRRRSSSSTSSSSSTIISTSAKSDQLSSPSAACIDYATVASLLTPYSRPKKSSRHPLGPALNTNLKPRARQGCASDPQSMAARQRRERINKRLKALQELVPNGSKVDLVTMLEKAINYVKFLQLQLQVLTDDEFWSNPQNLFQSNNDQVVSEEKQLQHGIQISSPNSTNLVPKVA